MLRCSLLLSLLFSVSTLAAIPDFDALGKLLPEGSQYAVTIIDSQTGKIYSNNNENLFLPPASTLKLVTALASSLYLPKDFSFETELSLANDHLIIKFGGDPTLTRKELKRLLAKLKQNKTVSIKGDIWLDESIFNGYSHAVGSPWDNQGVCYAAPSTAATLEKNCFYGTLYANKDKSTRIFVPQHQPVYAKTSASALSKEEQKNKHCELELLADKNNHFSLSGCTEAIDGPLALQFAIQNPAKYIADVTKQLLQELGISFKGKIHYSKPVPASLFTVKKTIAIHRSKTRDILLTEMLKDSDNLIANNLLKILGHERYQAAGNFRNGVSAMKEIIKEGTKINLDSAQFTDGSGLSRDNRMSTAQMAKIVLWIYKHPKLGIINMLPISGVDGTLMYRFGIRYKPIKQRLQAKSGSVYGSANLAGVLRRKDANLIVVQFVSNYFISNELKDNLSKRNWPLAKFERTLYETLLK